MLRIAMGGMELLTLSDNARFRMPLRTSDLFLLLTKFFSSDSVGVIVSVKPGQYNMQDAGNICLKLKKNLGKKNYLFLCNNLNQSEFENFNIGFWVNTSCPRVQEDSNLILNAVDVFK